MRGSVRFIVKVNLKV